MAGINGHFLLIVTIGIYDIHCAGRKTFNQGEKYGLCSSFDRLTLFETAALVKHKQNGNRFENGTELSSAPNSRLESKRFSCKTTYKSFGTGKESS
jgi:hypothetical protein